MTRIRVVLDTNVLLRAFISPDSVSGLILDACEHRRVVPLLSRPVLREYRAILGAEKLVARFP